ncbi:MAG: polysaccharide pyruvyl transferase family protein [Longimicrobiales bacterium]
MMAQTAMDDPRATVEPVSVAICGGVVGRNAIGDQAIVHGIIKSLKQEFGNLTVYLLSHDSDLQFESSECDVRVIDQNRCGFWQEAAILRKCSLMVIAMAVFAYNHSLRRLASAFVARMAGTPVMVWGVELSEPKNLRHLLALKLLAQTANVITVRDQRSFDVARRVGKKGAFTADPTFVLSSDSSRRAEAERILTGIGIDPHQKTVALCPRTLIAGLWHPFSSRSIETLVDELGILVHDLHAAGVQVVLVQMSPDQPDDDAIVISEILGRLDPHQRTPAVLAWRPELSGLMVDVFGHIDAVVAVRLHGAILAMLAGKPAITIAYEPKVHGIMDAVGLSKHVMPVEGFDGHRCAEVVLEWLENPDEIYCEVEARIEQVRARAFRNVPEAARLVAV